MIKTILVTGASGYIGSQLVTHLVENDYTVIALVRPHSELSRFPQNKNNFRFVYYDGTYESVAAVFGKYAIDIVYHLAAVSQHQTISSDINQLVAANITLGVHCLQAMVAHQCKYFINTGTYWQHFYDAETISPTCLYAASKQAFEVVIDYYVEAHNIQAITLKLYDVYGPDDFRPKLFNQLFQSALSEQSFDLSPGKQLVDLIYIDDVIAAYAVALTVIESKQTFYHQRYFVGTFVHYPLQEIVSQYQKLLNKPLNLNWGAKPYREKEVMAPVRGPALPGWQAKVPLNQGLAKVVASQQKNLATRFQGSSHEPIE